MLKGSALVVVMSSDSWLAEDLEHLEPSGHLAFASAQAYTSLQNSSWQVKMQSDLDSLTELRQLVVQCHSRTKNHTLHLLVDHEALGHLTLLGAKYQRGK